MGWLRDFMTQAGTRSFGELAREALAHPDWPEDTKAQRRSLEAILGRLDRREELDWLVDRPGIQQILAALLKVSVAEIRTILAESRGPRPTPGRLRLDDLRGARSLDLTIEPLPPGIPKRVELPATWSRCCWVAQPGAGAGLVGQWLAARGLAQTAVVGSLDDMANLPKVGPPLYLKVAPNCLDEFVEAWTGIQPLCVAVADSECAAATSNPLRGFEPIPSIPAASCLEQIVDWILYRTSASSNRQRQLIIDWLARGPVAWGVVQTLGDVLGFVGASIEGIFDPAAPCSKEELLRLWLGHRANDLAREKLRDVAALSQALPEILIDIAQAALIDDTRPLLAPRSIEDWLALVPEQHRRGPDIDWLTTRLLADNLAMRKPDLERAVKRLPPGAHRIVVALRELSILKPASAKSFALRPHFVARMVHAVGKERVVRSSPWFWGEALLHPTARAELLPVLNDRALRQPESLAEEALEPLDLENPALVCAFESSFVLLGLASLSGVELGEQAIASLLQEQAALLLYGLDSMPCPRTAPASPAGLPDLRGTFFLAAWALSENARTSGQPLPAALDPWHGQTLPIFWTQLLEHISDALQGALCPPTSWLEGAICMLDRLRQCVGAHTDPDQEPHRLFAPAVLLDAVSMGVLDWNQIEAIQNDREMLAMLLASLSPRSMTLEELMRAVGQAWLDAGQPATFYDGWMHWAPESIQYAPPELLARLLFSNARALPDPTIARLTAAVWQAWLDARTTSELHSEPEAPWRLMPLNVLDRALEKSPPVREAIRVIVWQRLPDGADRQIERYRSVAPVTAASWLKAAPCEQAPRIAKIALSAAWIRSDELVTTELQRLMYRAVSARVTDWQAAYDCLNQLVMERRRFDSLS